MTVSSSSKHLIDFEQWRELASLDPEGFEIMRCEVIEKMIAGSSNRRQRRLRGLQWRIDQVRAHSTTPMAACISLSNMMWESFAGEEGLADTLNRQRHGEVAARISAEVVPFPEDPKR